MSSPRRDRVRLMSKSSPQGMRGWRAERRKPVVSCLAARGRLSARQSAASYSTSGPALVRPVVLKCAGRAFSQLLTGARSGPGGCPDAARVPGLRSRTRGRRTPSRLRNRLMKAPSRGRGDPSLTELRTGGITSDNIRHGRACPGHPRLDLSHEKFVDARHFGGACRG
jgi:hypothetical protein